MPVDTAIIGQAVVEERFFAFERTVVLPQLAEHVRRRRAEGITAHRLQFQIRAQAAGKIFLKPRNLRGIQIFQNRIRQRAGFFVGVLKILRVKLQRLAHFGADLGDDIGGDASARLRAELLPTAPA